jgi:hypothetical protein
MGCTMRRYLISFLAGATLASFAWGGYLLWHQFFFDVPMIMFRAQEPAEAGERILEYLDDPQPQRAARVRFMATNLVVGASVAVDDVASRYPYLPVTRFWARRMSRYDNYMHEWRAAHVTNSVPK